MNIINNASAQFILPSRIADKCREHMDMIAAAPASGKLEAFNTGARYVAGLIDFHGYPRSDAADWLQETAITHGFVDKYGQDAIQRSISDAVDDPIPHNDGINNALLDEAAIEQTSVEAIDRQVTAFDLPSFLEMKMPPRELMLAPCYRNRASQ